MLEFYELAERLRPFLPPQELKQLVLMHEFPADAVEKETAKQLVFKLYLQHIQELPGLGSQILLEPPQKEVAGGEYPLGRVYHGSRPTDSIFGLREEDWIRHVAIFGNSGTGKTNTAMALLANLFRHDKPCLLLDWKKNYRDLTARTKKEILVFTVGNKDVSPFYFNPLIPPPGTKPGIWMKKLVEIMGHAFFLGEGVFSLLRKAIDAAYQEYHVYEAKPEVWPTMNDVLTWLEDVKARGRKQDWMDSSIRAVEALCYGDIAECLNVMRPMPLEQLLEKNVILELDALTEAEKTFFIEALLLWIHRYRMAQPDRETFKHAIVIEEAHHILLKKKQEFAGGESVTDVILREIRELGESIVLIDQHPSLISIPAIGDTHCTIGMGMKHKSDIDALGSAMLLDTKERSYLGQLPLGYGIVHLQGRYPRPFLVKFPHIKVKKGSVSDALVKQKMQGFWEGVLTPDEGFPNVTDMQPAGEVLREPRISSAPIGQRLKTNSQPAIREVPAPSGLVRPDNTESEDGKENGLSEGAKAFFMDIVHHPFDKLKSRYKRLGLTRERGDKLRRILAKAKLITEKVLVDKTCKWLFLEPTGKWERFKSENNSTRHGGVGHAYGLNRAVGFFKAKGLEVSDGEWPLGVGMYADRAVFISGQIEGTIECETMQAGNADIQLIQNVRKALEAGFKWVLIVVLDEKGQRLATKALEEFGFFEGKAKVKLVWELL